MQTFTYEEIREKALKQGVTDNRLRVGLWASSNGYIKSKRKIQGKKYFICKRILWMKKGMGENMKEASLIKRIKYYIFKVFSSFFKYESVKEYFGKIQVKYNDVTTKRVVTDGSYSFDKESIDREIVTNLESIQFEDEKFLAYVDRVQYLKKFYGNFMELPPEEERDRHIIQKVDFGPYV